MFSNSSYVQALRGVNCQQSSDEVLGLTGDEVRRCVIGCQYLFVKSRSVVILERQISTDHRKKDDPTAPQVTRLRHVTVACNHFRRRIARRSTCSFQFLVIPEAITQAEVYNLDALVLV
jgi:hypothetical protein